MVQLHVIINLLYFHSEPLQYPASLTKKIEYSLIYLSGKKAQIVKKILRTLYTYNLSRVLFYYLQSNPVMPMMLYGVCAPENCSESDVYNSMDFFVGEFL